MDLLITELKNGFVVSASQFPVQEIPALFLLLSLLRVDFFRFVLGLEARMSGFQLLINRFVLEYLLLKIEGLLLDWYLYRPSSNVLLRLRQNYEIT